MILSFLSKSHHARIAISGLLLSIDKSLLTQEVTDQDMMMRQPVSNQCH